MKCTDQRTFYRAVSLIVVLEMVINDVTNFIVSFVTLNFEYTFIIASSKFWELLYLWPVDEYFLEIAAVHCHELKYLCVFLSTFSNLF